MRQVRDKLNSENTKQGFTLIEVMIFLAVSGLLLVGVMGGTYSAIASQRYNDSVRSFSEFLRQMYAEVISPETLGAGDSDESAVYGKLIVFGLDDETKDDNRVYAATIVGSPDIPKISGGFIEELGAVDASLFCGINSEDGTGNFETTRSTYLPPWQAKVDNTSGEQFTGTIIIARSPSSGAVHTAYAPSVRIDLKDGCQPDDHTASLAFTDLVKNSPNDFTMSEDINFCLQSENSRLTRNIRLTADGRNTSAITLLDTDSEESLCR